MHYTVAELIGRPVVVVCGLKPVKLAGVQSHGMILTAVESGTGKLGLLSIMGKASVEAGTRVAPKNSKVCDINRLASVCSNM